MMTMTASLREQFRAWIRLVTDAVVAAIDRISTRRRVQLIETGRNSFTMRMPMRPKRSAPPELHFELADDAAGPSLPATWRDALHGSQLEAVLLSSRFLSCPLDLPRRATEFLDAMIYSQIDRLTPWTANEAVFGWTAPRATSNERIGVTVIAAPKAKINPLIRLAEAGGARSVILYAAAERAEADGRGAIASEIKVFEKRLQGSIAPARVSRFLAAVLLTAAVSATLCLTLGGIVAGRLDDQQRQLSGEISARRAAMRLKLAAFDDSAQGGLAQRKRAIPSSVMVLDALSRILPDQTYVTELRIEKDKLQIVGVTQDAASLVGLLEQSPHFARATFVAPTTRSADHPGEQFHVKAHIKPYFGPVS
jgi:general secretion pathway protein L